MQILKEYPTHMPELKSSTFTPSSYRPGLEGIIAGLSAISEVDPVRDRLTYRGYDAVELAKHSSYEEVAYLLIQGSLPEPAALDRFRRQLRASRKLPADLAALLKKFPRRSHPIDVLRTAISYLGLKMKTTEPGTHDENVAKSIRLVGQIPTIVAAGYRTSRGLKPIAPEARLGHASNFLYMMTGRKPDEFSAHIFNAAMILYADHGFNASTFSARVTASTLSDLHSSLTSAIGTLKGDLHGGANEKAMHMLLEIGSPARAESWVMNALSQKKKIMGFGHRVYKKGDSRAPLLRELVSQLAVRLNATQWCDISRIIEEVMMREKKLFPNVDFPAGLVYYLLGITIDLYTAIFAAARSAGWSAHVIEQLDDNKLIRPECHYTGPRNLPYVPIPERNHP